MIKDIKNCDFNQFKMEVKNNMLSIFVKDDMEWHQIAPDIDIRPFQNRSVFKLNINVLEHGTFMFSINLKTMEFNDIIRENKMVIY